MTKRLKIEKGSGNVFFDVGFPPGEAQNLLMRAELMLSIEQFVRKSGMTQKDAARALGVTQPRLNLLLKRRIELFSLDALVNMATRAGMKVKLTVKKAA
jgi:predicted XRE-type DNA-binding protein